MLISLLKALVIGVSVAAPVGPIGILVINRVLARGRWAGLRTGLGVATADSFYAAIAAFGLAALQNLLISAQTPVRLIGGLFLLYLGYKTMRSVPADHAAQSTSSGGLSDYVSALALTITNPMTILMFTGIFAGANLSGEMGGAPFIVIGVFCGSVLWWLFLSTVTSLLRGRFTPAVMVWVNRLSGSVIIAFAVVTLAGLLTQ
ncbi:MAG: LysE family translocator [Anaerolineae bacterium]